jgi:toxin FitB
LRLLLDTDILSRLRRPERSPRLLAWRAGVDEGLLYLSVATIGEIERGIARQQKSNADFAATLRQWSESVALAFGPRLLSFGPIEARIWAGLTAKLGHEGTDLIIAATALANDAAVVTGNVAHFRMTGVEVINPL